MNHRAATATLLLLLTLLLGLTACQPLPMGAPKIIGTLRIQGANVTVNETPATDGMAFNNGDVVATGPASRTRLELNSGGFIQFEENTDPGIVETIRKGLCWIIIKIEVGMFGSRTGNCGQIAQGPYGNEAIVNSQYVLAVGGQAFMFTLLDGRAEVRNGRQVRLQPGDQIVATRNFISNPRRISGREARLLIEWLESFDFTGMRTAITPVAVPAVVGLGMDRARQILERVGLALGQIAERPIRKALPGTILDQKPNAGTRVPPGTAIYVDVAVPQPPPVRVPDLRGLPLAEAEQQLAQARLRLGESKARVSKAKPGTIIAQTPPANSMVRPGSLVEVVVAQARWVEVPALVGLTLEEAKQRLSHTDLRLGSIEERQTAAARPRTIIAQQPEPGTQLPPRAQVSVTVATGLRLQRVPELIGSSLEEADRRLHEAGLRRGKVSEEATRTFEPDTVMRQSPQPGTLVEEGTWVDVTIARPLPVFHPPPPIRPWEPPQQQPRLCRAPKIDGLPYERAKQLLAERGLTGRVRRTYGYNRNTVYRQDPQPGVRFPCDQPITFDLGTIG